MVKIAYFQNECAPYRIPVFEGISRLPNVNLKVYFGRSRSFGRRWRVTLNYSFDYEVLREVDFVPRLFSFNLEDDGNPLNQSLLFKLLHDNYDVFVGGVPHYFGTLITFLVSKIRRKPFVLFLEDIDVGTGEISLYLCRFRKNPLKAFNAPLILIRFFFGQLVLKNSSCCIVPGTATKEYLLRRGVSPSRIFTAWNAVDNNAIEQECSKSDKKGSAKKLRAQLGIENKKMILSVAYLTERKGLQYLIQACARLKKENDDFALVIVGEGPCEEDLKKLSYQNDLEAIFVGYALNLVDYYLAADIFVLPTLEDVWGFVINEAMVCGCPIITTRDAGASRDLVKNGVNGYVVETRNVEQLYHAIKRILNDEKLRQDMKKASRHIIGGFSYETSLEGYRAAIAYLMS